MSLVGTRPILPDELEQYELHHRARIAIKPGITGMWQVSGRSDITDFEEIVRLDTEYISEWNICRGHVSWWQSLWRKREFSGVREFRAITTSVGWLIMFRELLLFFHEILFAKDI